MSATTTTSPASYSRAARPLSQRVNWRLVIFLGVIAAPFLYFFYVLVSQSVTGGITQRGDYAEVDLKALGNFAFDQTNGTLTDVPERYRKLDGKKVELKGFMFSPDSAGDQATRFQFVYNVQKCCFNGPPQVQERVFAHVRDGSSVQIYDLYKFVRVVGTLHVRVQTNPETGVVTSVYEMDVDKAEPVNS